MTVEILIALVIVGGIYLRNLYAKISALEHRLQKLESTDARPIRSATQTVRDDVDASMSSGGDISVEAPVVEMSTTMPVTNVASPDHKAPLKEASVWGQGIETAVGLFKANPFASIGVFLVLIGVGFLFSLLAASNILPPALRLILVALSGAVLFGLGISQEQKRPGLAANLQGGAIAIEFLCALWAYRGYELIGPVWAFAWMGCLSALAVGWSIYTRRGLFAFMGIFGSLLTPILASTGGGTFLGLTTYVTWIAAMGLGTAFYLGMPSMASMTIMGVAALLGTALGIDKGYQATSLCALGVMMTSSSGLAMYWASEKFMWRPRQQASIVSLLVGAPLGFTGFMYAAAGLSAHQSAFVIGAVASIYLLFVLRLSQAWKGWFLSLGSGLGLVAIGVGFEGASRAIAFSASAIGIVLVSRAIGRPWAAWIALAFWILSVIMGWNESSALPMSISGVIAIGTAYLLRGESLSRGYAALGSAVLFVIFHRETNYSDTGYMAIICGWATGALLASNLLRWREIKFGAIWVLPAIVVFIMTSPRPLAGQDQLVRELVILFGLGVVSVLLNALSAVRTTALQNYWATHRPLEILVLPLLLSIEIWRVADVDMLNLSSRLALIAVLWSLWSFGTTFRCRKLGWFAASAVTFSVAALFLVINLINASSGVISEVGQWVCVVSLFCTAFLIGDTPDVFKSGALGLAGGALASSGLRAIGIAYGLDERASFLLFAEAMQPWVSLFWATGSIAVVMLGSKIGNRKMWIGGTIAIGLLMAKMLVVDLSTFSLVAKVSVFMATGIAFIGLGAYSALPPLRDKDKGTNT